MAIHGCTNGTLDAANYSSPVPFIGLYIAAASVVCMLLMLYDIVAGLYAKQIWLPCKLFTLNSVILTLLSIAAKLPLDLTSPMPSPKDQLSKLCGPSLICISMGFLLPSIGVNSDRECFTNLAAVTIFVVTIVANICLEISTGVIVLFIGDHIVIMSCLSLMLMTLWFSFWYISSRKRISIDHNKDIITKGNGTMFQRLKTSCMISYCSNPQLVLCLCPISVFVGTICLICSIILVRAALTSTDLKLCVGISDYEWSTLTIVITQILTVVVGCVAIVSRCLTLFRHMDYVDYLEDILGQEAEDVIDKNPTLRTVSTLVTCQMLFRDLCISIIFIVHLLIIYVPLIVLAIFWTFVDEDYDISLEEWTEQKATEDIKRWIEVSKRKSASDTFSQLLFRTNPSQQLHCMELKDDFDLSREGVKVSSLSIALLLRIAQVSLPNTLCGTLVQTFTESKEIIHFIDSMINPQNVVNKNKLLFAEAVWAGDNYGCLLDKIFADTSSVQIQSDIDRAVIIITRLKNVLPCDFVWDELGNIVDFITRKTYTSIADLCCSVEQMFVDMLHGMFAQLPNAIFKMLIESPAEEYEDKVRLGLKLICKVESIEAQIQWLFPAGCNIARLISTDVLVTSSDVIIQVQ